MSEMDPQRRDWTIAGAVLLAVVTVMAIGVWRQSTHAAHPASAAAGHGEARPGARRLAAPITRSVEVRDVPVAGHRER